MKTRPKILLGTLVCFTSWFHLYGDITIQGPTPANHTPTSKCPAKDGGNELNPAVPQHIPPPAATGGIIEELRSGDNPYPGWTFTNGPALSGTLNIDYYHSKFLSAHYSGAQIQATYTPGSNDPARLRFVQMIDTTAPITNTLKGPYIDPYPDDDKLATNRPFYYTEEETASYGNSFYDFSKRSHPPNSKVEWTGILHLSSWDGNTPGTVTLHDGIKWGFKAACATNAPQKPKAVKQKDKVVVTYTSGGPVVDLEHTGLLGPATTWLKVTNGIVETNGTFVYTVNEPGDQEFFRLSSEIPFAVDVPIPAHIRVPPLPTSVEAGQEASLFVKAAGTLPVHYQWFRDRTPLPDETNASLVIPNAQPTQQGIYHVEVFNDAGSEPSEPVELVVQPDVTPPRLDGAEALSPVQLWVAFSEPVDPFSASLIGHYEVLGPTGPVPVMNAFPQPAPGNDSVVLNLSFPLTPGALHTLVVMGVSDLAGNVIQPPDNSVDFVAP